MEHRILWAITKGLTIAAIDSREKRTLLNRLGFGSYLECFFRKKKGNNNNNEQADTS